VRFVADTNIVISGLLWRGAPRRVLDSVREFGTELFTSPDILSELDEVLRRPKFASLLASAGSSPQQLLPQYAALATLVHPVYTPSAVARDPDDNTILACAVAAGASHIVSGDDDLLQLGGYQDIEIVTAVQFLASIGNRDTV
jgi:putative PIN family toxin of toxin-antitoxin system